MVESDLHEYIEHCIHLRRDIDHVIEDYTLATTGWTTHYAVDFSEIFAYVLPYENVENAPFGDSWVNDPVRQFYVLSRFFGRGEVILPEPYAIELRAFFDRLLMQSYQDLKNVLDESVEKFRRIADGKDSHRVLRLADANRGLRPEEVQATIRFFEEQAPGLVAFARGADLQPVDRLKRLFRKRVFIRIEEKIGEVPLPLRADVRRVYDLIGTVRAHASAQSNYLDARAIEEIRIANHKLQSEQARILLVTRSRTTMAVVDQLSKQPEWRGIKPFVRHPRVFSPKYWPANDHNDESIAELKLRRDSLEVFINSAKDAPGEGKVPASLEQIRKEWRDVEALATAFVRDGEMKVGPRNAVASPKRVAKQLLEFLRDPQRKFYEHVTTRVEQIFSELRRERELLAVQLHANVKDETLPSVMYSIEFTSPTLRRRLADYGRRWNISFDEAAALYEVPAEQVSDYERLLAMSVSLGAIRRWAIAERYATYAMQFASEVPVHEAHFFRAFCHRKNSRVGESTRRAVARMRAAKELLDTAETQRKADGARIDARYLKERAVLYLEWLDLVKASGNEALREADTPTLETIETLLREADAAAGDDGKMKITIYNNFCYLYLNDLPAREKDARQYLGDLQQALEHYGVKNPPSLIEDTVVWGTFKLAADEERSLLETWHRRLTSLAKGRDLTPGERETLERHYCEVANAIAGVA